jgi:hypothetical protein
LTLAGGGDFEPLVGLSYLARYLESTGDEFLDAVRLLDSSISTGMESTLQPMLKDVPRLEHAIDLLSAYPVQTSVSVSALKDQVYFLEMEKLIETGSEEEMENLATRIAEYPFTNYSLRVILQKNLDARQLAYLKVRLSTDHVTPANPEQFAKVMASRYNPAWHMDSIFLEELFHKEVKAGNSYRSLALLAFGLQTQVFSPTTALQLISISRYFSQFLSDTLADGHYKLAARLVHGFAGLQESYVPESVLSTVGELYYSRIFQVMMENITVQNVDMVALLILLAKDLQPVDSDLFVRNVEKLRNSKLVPLLIEALKSEDVPMVRWILDVVVTLELSENKIVLAALNALWNHKAYEQARNILAVESGRAMQDSYDLLVME